MDGGVLIMKKYLKEILILLIQLFMFYVFPLFAGPTDVMGMIVLLILATLLLSILIGSISNLKVKYLYPIIIAITFVPSVFIYYNETALANAETARTVSFCSGGFLHLFFFLLLHLFMGFLLNISPAEKPYLK